MKWSQCVVQPQQISHNCHTHTQPHAYSRFHACVLHPWNEQAATRQPSDNLEWMSLTFWLDALCTDHQLLSSWLVRFFTRLPRSATAELLDHSTKQLFAEDCALILKGFYLGAVKWLRSSGEKGNISSFVVLKLLMKHTIIHTHKYSFYVQYVCV